ncbi:MAG: peptidase T [Bacteroidales bacterium]|nr:MAG: peptidase T [Bacteroidales bacterium]
MDNLVERFVRYVKINTRSDEKSKSFPSTKNQLELAKMLAQELKDLGLSEIDLDKNGYLMATLPANTKDSVPTIGFIAHLDTSPDVPAENAQPRIVDNYYGKNIVLNKKANIVLSPKEFIDLNTYIGQPIIVTDGNTLLGADDKAGIAEIITAVEYLITHPRIKHGKIRLAFTPDEEIHRGTDKFDVKKFNVDFAYTVDGGPLGELEYENFNAARAKITIKGLNVHPGTAKNKMKNSMLIAMELNSMLPSHQSPAHTEGYEGFYHLTDMTGSVDSTTINYLIRDHDKTRFNKKKDLLIRIVDHLNLKYGARTIKITMIDQYYNMREIIEPEFHIVKLAIKAMNAAGVSPKIVPIRGGTDGAKLSYMGIPCPNIFAGGHNFHSKYEFIPIKSMEKSVKVIVKIAELNAKQNKK